jgi:hypothetical protein
VRGLNALFSEALTRFVAQLVEQAPDSAACLPTELVGFAQTEPDSWFGKGSPKMALDTLGTWAVAVCDAFSGDEGIRGWSTYQMVALLVSDYCQRPGEEPPDKPRGKGKRSKKKASPGQDKSSSSSEQQPVPGVPGQTTGHEALPQALQTSPVTSTDTLPGPQQDETPPADPGVKVHTKGRRGGRSLQSLFDPDASYGHKGIGYGVQLSETCGHAGPEIITDYALQDGADNDWGKASGAVERLSACGRAPHVLYADAGYPTPASLHALAAQGVELRAPLAANLRAEENALDRNAFVFTDDGHVASCPAGHAPTRHDVARQPGCAEPEWHAYFDGNLCRTCPLAEKCPARGKATGSFWLRIEPRLRTRDAMAAAQRDPAWWQSYAIRAGVEATFSELKRGHGLDRLPVRGRVRVLQRVSLKISACNIKRWLRAVG